jgi:multidrug efflux pump
MGLVIASGLAIGTLFTLFVVPAVYMMFAADHNKGHQSAEPGSELPHPES